MAANECAKEVPKWHYTVTGMAWYVNLSALGGCSIRVVLEAAKESEERRRNQAM